MAQVRYLYLDWADFQANSLELVMVEVLLGSLCLLGRDVRHPDTAKTPKVVKSDIISIYSEYSFKLRL